jgi:hypothetical protein
MENFKISPKGALICKDQPLKEGVKLKSGGVSFSCTRILNTAISLILNTEYGGKSIWLERKPNIKIVKYNWEYRVTGGPDTGWTTCWNKEEGFVGGAVDCRGDQTCGHATPIRGLCLVRYGTGHTQVDDIRYKHSDKWSYQVKGGPNTGWTTCNLNDNDIGTAHDCRNDGSCGNASSITGWCAGRYGF